MRREVRRSIMKERSIRRVGHRKKVRMDLRVGEVRRSVEREKRSKEIYIYMTEEFKEKCST